jgi:hypothetical protein
MLIHVNSHTIRSNSTHNKTEPPLSVRRTRSAKPEYAHQVIIRDNNGTEVARVVYQPESPLNCGAKVWIETNLTVEPVLWDSE